MSGTTRRIIGFDRKVRLRWLDATAEWTMQGLSVPEVRAQLERLLDGQVAGEGPHSARGKTMTVLLHVWTAVPDAAVPLRDDALVLLGGRTGRDRLPLHWGMCLATYPFFRDVAATTGRLLALQGEVALSQIVRRMAESWGERSTLTRAVQRVVRSFVEWGVLAESGDRGSLFARGEGRGARRWSRPVVGGGRLGEPRTPGIPVARARRWGFVLPARPGAVRRRRQPQSSAGALPAGTRRGHRGSQGDEWMMFRADVRVE